MIGSRMLAPLALIALSGLSLAEARAQSAPSPSAQPRNAAVAAPSGVVPPVAATVTSGAVVATPAVKPVAAVGKRSCTRLGFSVNDYGKDGPAKDAQELLDKYIAKWAEANAIKKYKVGKKDVTCELYLNLIVFDEHTCTAAADVCWNGKPSKDQLVSPQ